MTIETLDLRKPETIEHERIDKLMDEHGLWFEWPKFPPSLDRWMHNVVGTRWVRGNLVVSFDVRWYDNTGRWMRCLRYFGLAR